MELDAFHHWAIERPSLRQEAENALTAGDRFKGWRKELRDRLPSGATLKRGLLALRGLSARPEVAQPKLILRAIASQSVEVVFGHKAEDRHLILPPDFEVPDHRPCPSYCKDLIADFEETIANLGEDIEIFRLVVEGYSFRQIAERLNVSRSYAQDHHANIKRVLDFPAEGIPG